MKMKMKMAFVMMALLLLPSITVLAGQAGKSSVYQINLVQKDSAWNPVQDGAFGKLHYKSTGDFVFNGHLLTPGVEYTLLNYVNYGVTNNFLGKAVADEEGNVHIAGYSQGALSNDLSVTTATGAKFWLVPSTSLSADYKFVSWTPSMMLFEMETIQLPIS